MVRAASVLATAAVAATPVAAPVKVAPGRAVSGRVYARAAGELSVRLPASRCSLRIGVDLHAPLRVRPRRAAAEYRVAAVARGWHSMVVRSAGCRTAVVIRWLLTARGARPRGGTPTNASPSPGGATPAAPAGNPSPASNPANPAPAPSPTGGANPFAGQRFYIDPNSNAAQAKRSYLAQGDGADAGLMAKIAGNPQADWFGDWNGTDPSADVSSAVATAGAAGALPVLVAYDIPGRDCGGYSAGGAGSADAYRAWIDGFARGIGGERAVVVLEPDAIPELDCMSTADQQTTLALLSYAVQTLSANPATAVYIDAGNSGWQPPSVIAARLQAADVAQARGFSLNVSNFDTTASEESYGDSIAALIGGKHFIVDTSRNGQGSDGQWCNPPGRGLGQPATTATGDPLTDALFWIKAPGESDGTCNGGPAAGTWWPAYALGLAQNAAF